jgi:FRG domain
MTGDLEDEAALDHPGNAVVIALTVGFDPWEAHQLGGDGNTTYQNIVIMKFECSLSSLTCPSSILLDLSLFDTFNARVKAGTEFQNRCGPGQTLNYLAGVRLDFSSINKQTMAIDEFLEQVRKGVDHLKVHERRAWYRGLANSEYELLPTLHRTFLPEKIPPEKIRQREKNLFSRFQMQAGELIPRGLESSWEILSVMQHYGVPTRVMDWSLEV